MKFLGFNISRDGKAQKNDFDGTNLGTPKRMNIADMVKRKGEIRISRDVFYGLYIRNGDIRSCIRDISKRVGVRGIYLEKDGEVYEKGGLTRSVQKLFRDPTWLDFKVELFKHLMVGGECFIVPIKDGFDKPVGFRFLDPRTMVKFYSKETGEITRYEQRITGEKPTRFTIDELSYYQFEKNPDDAYNGLSIIEGIVYRSLIDQEAQRREYFFFENGMMPDGIIMLDSEFDADELEIAKSKLIQELQGTANSHKMLITNTVKDVKALSLSPKDLDNIAQSELTTEKICSAIGTPKFLIGYTEGVQRSNGDSSYKNYIEGTIVPCQEYAEYIINGIYAKFVDPRLDESGVEIRLDGEKTEDRAVIETAQREDIKLGLLSPDEARKERGKTPWDIKGLTDVPLMIANVGVFTDAPAKDTQTTATPTDTQKK